MHRNPPIHGQKVRVKMNDQSGVSGELNSFQNGGSSTTGDIGAPVEERCSQFYRDELPEMSEPSMDGFVFEEISRSDLICRSFVPKRT
jgi:hypothetical protein